MDVYLILLRDMSIFGDLGFQFWFLRESFLLVTKNYILKVYLR